MDTLVRPTPAAPKAPAAAPQAVKASKAQAPARLVDVALFRNLPGAGTPLVTPGRSTALRQIGGEVLDGGATHLRYAVEDAAPAG